MFCFVSHKAKEYSHDLNLQHAFQWEWEDFDDGEA